MKKFSFILIAFLCIISFQHDVKCEENYSIGSTIIFGQYEQDNDFSNGNEAIEWIVIETHPEQIVLLSRYVLDRQPYSEDFSLEEYEPMFDSIGTYLTSWEESSLRTWLNTTFIHNAFSADEIEQLCYVELRDEDKLHRHGILLISNVNDQVFLLDDDFAITNQDDTGLLQGMPTEYVAASYSKDGECKPVNWWLRSPGDKDSCASSITDEGYLVKDWGTLASLYGVRPVIVLNRQYLDSERERKEEEADQQKADRLSKNAPMLVEKQETITDSQYSIHIMSMDFEPSEEEGKLKFSMSFDYQNLSFESTELSADVKVSLCFNDIYEFEIPLARYLYADNMAREAEIESVAPFVEVIAVWEADVPEIINDSTKGTLMLHITTTSNHYMMNVHKTEK